MIVGHLGWQQCILYVLKEGSYLGHIKYRKYGGCCGGIGVRVFAYGTFKLNIGASCKVRSTSIFLKYEKIF